MVVHVFVFCVLLQRFPLCVAMVVTAEVWRAPETQMAVCIWLVLRSVSRTPQLRVWYTTCAEQELMLSEAQNRPKLKTMPMNTMSNSKFRGRELNPGLPRDRRKY